MCRPSRQPKTRKPYVLKNCASNAQQGGTMELDPQMFKPASRLEDWAEEATYREQIHENYRGNPYIEALPEILDEPTATAQLQYYPGYDEKDRHAAPKDRIHFVANAVHFFDVAPRHLE